MSSPKVAEAVPPIKSICPAIGLLAFLLASRAMLAQEPPVVAGDPINGKRVFIADGCYYCHGTTGGGGGVAGPRLAPNPLPLEGLKAKLRTASGRMPVYSPRVLEDRQIADIWAYLQSIPRGKEAKDIPLLSK